MKFKLQPNYSSQLTLQTKEFQQEFHKFIALFHFDFVPLLCFVPSLIHQVEEVVPVYLQLWPTNPERENCLSLKEQILATFSFFSADKYILLCSCLTQCQYSNFCISENPITYIKSPLCTKFRGFTKWISLAALSEHEKAFESKRCSKYVVLRSTKHKFAQTQATPL